MTIFRDKVRTVTPIEIPVLFDHDPSRVIGKLSIDPDMLPSGPDYVFSLGYRATEVAPSGDVLKHELLEVTLVSDAEYSEYLAQHDHLSG